MISEIFLKFNKAIIFALTLLILTPTSFASIEHDKELLKRFNIRLDIILKTLPRENIQVSDLKEIKPTFQKFKGDHLLLKETLARLNNNSSLNDTISNDLEDFILAIDAFYLRNELLTEEKGSISELWHELVQTYHFYSSLWNLNSIRKMVNSQQQFILHNNLPVFSDNIFNNQLTAGDIVPSYQSQIATAYEQSTSDSDDYSDHSRNALIVNKAHELNNDPIAIYAFVSEKISAEIYVGSRKGPLATLFSKAGNDVDQALLLQALLKAAGYESTLITGISKVSASYFESLWGIKEQQNLIAILRDSGQQFELLTDTSLNNSILWQHTWVSSKVPYDSYRGAEVEEALQSWVALDPYQPQTSQNQQQASLASDTDLDQLWYQHLTQNGAVNFLQSLQQELPETIEDYTAEAAPSISYLPASLPYEVERIILESHQTPAIYDNQIQLTITSGGTVFSTELLQHSFSIAELYNRNVSISFEGASPEDQQKILRNGGINNTLLSDVHLKASLRIDNELVALSDSDINAGEVLTIDFKLNNISESKFQKLITAGSFYSLGTGGGAVIEDSSKYTNWPDQGAGIRYLSQAAYRYLNNVQQDNLKLGAMLGHKVFYPLPTFTFVSNANKIDYLMDQPAFLDWTGVEMDALFQPTASIATEASNFTQEQVIKSSALNSSWYEQDTFETLFELTSISADEAIATAFNTNNFIAKPSREQIQNSQHNQTIKNAMLSSLEAGHDLYITENPFTSGYWNGSAWIAINPTTGASGYYLSGGIAGGTNTDPEGNDKVWTLLDPESATPNEGSENVAFLVSQASSFDVGVAGENQTIRVRALSKTYAPVINAMVNFQILTGNAYVGSFSSQSQTYTATTDASGYATAQLTYDTNTGINARQYRIDPQDRYSSRIAEVRIGAVVPNVTSLDSPIVKLYGPDQPVDGIIQLEIPNIYAASLDQYGNPVSNVNVTVSANGIKDSDSDDYIEDFGDGLIGVGGGQGKKYTGKTSSELAYIASIYPGTYCSTRYKFNVAIDSGPRKELIREKCPLYNNTENLSEIEEVELGTTICGNHLTNLYASNGTLGARHILTTPGQTKDKVITILTRMCEIYKLQGRNSDGKLQDAAVWEIPLDDQLPGVRITSPTGQIKTHVSNNDYIIDVTGTTVGEHGIQYTDDFTYGGGKDIRAATYYTVAPSLETPPEISTVEINPGDFVTSDNALLRYSLGGTAPSRLGKQPMVILYEGDTAIASFYSQSYASSGHIIIPSGTPFNDETKDYSVELVVYHGLKSTEVRSEKIPLLGKVLKGTTRQLIVQHEADLSGGIIYKNDQTDFIVRLGTRAMVVISATLITSSNESPDATAESIPVYEGELPRGQHTLELDFSELEPAEYHLAVSATSTTSFKTGYGGSTLVVKVNKSDILPIAHAIYENVDLHDGSLNLQRQDLSIPLEELSLSFGRQYNSSFTSESYLGAGWSDLNLHTLTELQRGVFSANGIRFEETNDGIVPVRGYHGKLKRDGESFDLYTKGGVKYHYRKFSFNKKNQWSVEYIQPPRGSSLSYSYVIDDYDIPRIASIEDGYSRKLVYYYDTYKNNKTGDVVKRLKNVELKGKDAELSFIYDDALRLQSVTLAKANQTVVLEQYTYLDSEYATIEEKVGETPEGEEELENRILAIKQQSLGRLLSTIDAEGYETSYTYIEEHLPAYGTDDKSLEEFKSPIIASINNKRGNNIGFNFSFKDKNYNPDINSIASTVTISGSDWNILYKLNGYGSILELTDGAGTEITNWNEEHLLPASVTDRKGNKSTFSYDDSGNKTETKFRSNQTDVTITNEYTSLPTLSSNKVNVYKIALLQRTDGEGRITSYEYTNKNCPYPTQQSYPRKYFTYDNKCRLASETDGNGNRYSYEYDDQGYRKNLTGPIPINKGVGRLSKKFNYNTFGELTSTTDFDNIPTTYTNNIYGLPLIIERALGNTLTLSYDKLGRKLTETDAIGRTTTYTYDGAGNTLSEQRSRGCTLGNQLITRTMVYTERNSLMSEQDWNGNTTSYDYDGAERLIAVHLPLSRVTYGLDKNGNRKTESYTIDAGRSGTIHRSFNEQNQVVSEIDGDGNQQTWEYDTAGNQTKATNKSQLVTINEYDAYNRRISTTQNGTPQRKTLYEYDLNGWLVKQTELSNSGDPRVTKQKYDELGRVIETKISQGTDSAVTFQKYNPLGNLISETDPVSSTTSYEYDSLYRRVTSTNALDEETTNTYDLVGRLLTQSNPNGNQQNYTYNDSDLVTQHNDSLGIVSASKYDCQGNQISNTDGKGNTTSYEYNALNQQTKVALPTTDKYTYTYNHQGQVLTESNPLDSRRTLTYNNQGAVLTEQDFNGHTTSYTRDALGNPISITDPLGNTTSYEYNKYGDATQITDPLYTQTFDYDSFGRQIKSTDRRGIKTEVKYNFLGLESSIKRNNQLRQKNTYYPDGQLAETFDGEGNRTFFEYDKLKRTTLESGELLAITQYQHNTTARTRKIISPDGVITDETYDVRGNLLTTLTDGAQTEFEYDQANNQKRKLLPEGNDVNYTYDKLNRLETITDGENNVTSFVFDDIGLKRSHTDGKGITTEFDYDNNGNLTSINYAKESEQALTTSFTYDAMNNRKTQVLPAYGTLTYGYDALNRLTSQSDSTGSINWTLDGNGNATQTDYSFTTARNGLEAAVETASYNQQDLRTQYTDIAGLTTQWRYNNNDLVEEITYPSLAKTRYTFDARNRTLSALMKGGSVSYEYYNDDLIKKASYANGAVSAYAYTPRNQVKSIKHTINDALLSELSYTYDLNDNRKTETKNNGTGEVVTSYEFDNNDRIERIDYPAQYNELAKTVAYQFDAANNRELETITQGDTDVTKTYAYNDLDQLTSISSTDTENTQVEYDYDGNGNLAQKRSSKTLNNVTQTETNDYAFDIRGQLKSVTMGGSSIGQFLYDDAGQRLRTQYNTLENGQPSTQTHAQHSLYQGLKLISQYDVSENNSLSLNANYQFASSNSGVMNIGRRAYNEDDTANNTQTYYHTDSLGSILATSKANKSIAARYDYDAWGKELNNTDTSDNPLGYTGHQMDRESENKTGLIYANARYLDPDTGRFLSFDPFEGYDEKPISLHRYMYAYQNPVRYTDPTGNYAELPLEIASIGIGLYSAASNYLDGDTDAALEDLAYVGADIALAVVPGAPGGLGIARQVAKEGAEALTDSKKLDHVADTASNAKSATKTTKESSTSVNSKVEALESPKTKKRMTKSEKIAEQEKIKGGAHKDTTKPANDNLDSHHMPAKDAYKDKRYPETDDKVLNPKDGPAVKVKPKTHHATSSHGNTPDAIEYREDISELLDQGKWRDAMATEVKDLRRASKVVEGNATNYNEGIQQMLKYAKENGLLNKQ